MLFSDWSSDVFSSDLFGDSPLRADRVGRAAGEALVRRDDTDEVAVADHRDARHRARAAVIHRAARRAVAVRPNERSEERRVGKGCFRTCGSRRATYQLTKNSNKPANTLSKTTR